MRFGIWDVRYSMFDIRLLRRLLIWLWTMIIVVSNVSLSQIENVPVNNQVYEFLDRMGVKGIIPLYSNTMIPISRKEVAEYLIRVDEQRDKLNNTEVEYLDKFREEFMHEINPSDENPAVLFGGSSFENLVSDKEKYLYDFRDSTISFYMEFIGSLEHRQISGDSYGAAYSTFEEHGGRIRGTIKNRLGYYLQATNGTMYGNREFALSDPRLKGNVKLNDLDSPYFDFTEAYLRADLDWFNLEFGREHNMIGTGYSDRLLLSSNAPVFDFLKLDFQYKSFRFLFMQGSLVDQMSASNKYLALHRAQFSLFNVMNVGLSEMILYQRNSVDFAYMNPINFYKSSEHSLRDKDNAFLNFDLEVFPFAGYKFYGTWLIDDLDFKKMGTGWWGNEFGWQGGLIATDLAGFENIDGFIEYTRLEPYVYSNRISGNSFTNNSIGLAHHLQPNSDELVLQFAYRPNKRLRTWIGFGKSRHGENKIIDGIVLENYGGNIDHGHRQYDSETARFLEGDMETTYRFQLKAVYEPLTNFFISGLYEYQQIEKNVLHLIENDHYGSIRLWVEY
ncbi:MAG: hypothetical protein HZB59_02960 [Ignavibacteriales bacterium]|nr:hypothetical protein [Ignavibacteriales bacterium]